MSSGNLEELDIIWQPQIKDSMKSYLNLFSLLFWIIPFIIFSIIYNRDLRNKNKYPETYKFEGLA